MSAPSCCRRHRQPQRECALSRTSRVFAIVLLLQSIVTTAAATDGFGRLAPFSGSGSGAEEETSPTTPSVSTTSPPTSSPPGNRGKKNKLAAVVDFRLAERMCTSLDVCVCVCDRERYVCAL